MQEDASNPPPNRKCWSFTTLGFTILEHICVALFCIPHFARCSRKERDTIPHERFILLPPLPFLRRCGAAVSLLFFQDVKKSNLPYFRQRLPRGGGREKVEQEDPSAAPSGKKFIFLQRTASSMYTSISPGLFTQSQRPATNPSGRMHTCTYTAPFTVSPSFYLL